MQGVLPIIRKGNGCDYHRILQPLKYMGFDLETFEKAPGITTFDGVEILFYNRTPLDDLDKVLGFKKKYGFKMVVDIDDYWELNVNHLLYKGWKNLNFAQTIIKGLAAADAVICTTARLAEKVKPFNKNIHIIPNALPFGEEQFNDDHTIDDCTRFIYAGGVTHQWDLRLLMNPFKKLANEQLNSKFILAGFNDSNEESRELWSKIERDFNVNGQLKGYIRKNTLDIDHYMNHYIDADVSLVPLESNIFTPYKSNLKIVEAGCKNIPVIVSNTPPYSDEADKGPLMIAQNASDWYRLIKYCAKNPGFVYEKGQELGEYVRNNYDLRKVNVYREQLFNHLKTK